MLCLLWQDDWKAHQRSRDSQGQGWDQMCFQYRHGLRALQSGEGRPDARPMGQRYFELPQSRKIAERIKNWIWEIISASRHTSFGKVLLRICDVRIIAVGHSAFGFRSEREVSFRGEIVPRRDRRRLIFHRDSLQISLPQPTRLTVG